MPIPLMNMEMLARESASLIENYSILEPELPAEILAVKIIDEGDPEFLGELSRSLLVGHFRRGILSRKAAIARERYRKFLLPKFEHLPRMIIGKRGKRILLINGTYADLRDYCKVLSRGYGERKRNDLKFKEAQALRDHLQKESLSIRGITASESLGLDFGEEEKGGAKGRAD